MITGQELEKWRGIDAVVHADYNPVIDLYDHEQCIGPLLFIDPFMPKVFTTFLPQRNNFAADVNPKSCDLKVFDSL